jgi:hypothetical protein
VASATAFECCLFTLEDSMWPLMVGAGKSHSILINYAHNKKGSREAA